MQRSDPVAGSGLPDGQTAHERVGLQRAGPPGSGQTQSEQTAAGGGAAAAPRESAGAAAAPRGSAPMASLYERLRACLDPAQIVLLEKDDEFVGALSLKPAGMSELLVRKQLAKLRDALDA